jgi:hypothetical protein
MNRHPVRQPGSRSQAADCVALFLALLCGTVSIKAAEPQPSTDQFYDPDVVQAIHLEIKTDDLDRLRRALPKRIYVPATFRWNETTLSPVGVRYKGNSSSAPESPHKRSFLIAFSEFKPGQQFLGCGTWRWTMASSSAGCSAND